MRVLALGRTYALAVAFLALLGVALVTTPAGATVGRGSGGAGAVELPPPDSGGDTTPPGVPLPTTPLPTAQLSADGRTAIPPAAAPLQVKNAIYAANQITRKPYRYGGGHRSFKDTAYDCSGSVSYALRGGGLLTSPLHSTAFMKWGLPGRGLWITVYTNPGHAYAVIAGLRFDTSQPDDGEEGPGWSKDVKAGLVNGPFKKRHWVGL